MPHPQWLIPSQLTQQNEQGESGCDMSSGAPAADFGPLWALQCAALAPGAPETVTLTHVSFETAGTPDSDTGVPRVRVTGVRSSRCRRRSGPSAGPRVLHRGASA
jgi:hypothetical protein